ncbi:hypothetical protein [Cystobacter ferrugineus]|uniref:Lipoprotein n=1 Tax=Cystobacter ferrugineus TaxID=83449 RepID=A0A1L9BKV6_9BACT|nr:hypothetical protein [Cystobacter ferrugineus]OJH42859.1 hypothetical protein BON30_01640 [Cystobacter ferrugineus]
MKMSWIRGMGLLVATLGLAACGGPIEEESVTDVTSTEQALRMCDLQGRCGTNEVCVGGPGGTCYPCGKYPQYCELAR